MLTLHNQGAAGAGSSDYYNVLPSPSPTARAAITRLLRDAFGEPVDTVRYQTPPLDVCHAYRDGDDFLFVSLGLTNLDSTASDGLWSGAGYELTMRTTGSVEAPEWPYRVIGAVARHVASGHELRVGDYVDTGRPLNGLTDSAVTSLLVVPDLALPVIQSCSGAVRFLQLVGVYPHEVAGPVAPAASDLITSLARRHPMLATEPYRDAAA